MSKKEDAKERYLNSPEGQTLRGVLAKHGLGPEDISETMLPDDADFGGGAKVVSGGTFCYTAKEYKEAQEKADPDMGGWHG